MRALASLELGLAIQERLGDRVGQRDCLSKMATLHRSQNRLAEAEHLLAQAVAIGEALEHPHLEEDRAVLAELHHQIAAAEAAAMFDSKTSLS